jgi:hypothetical protein
MRGWRGRAVALAVGGWLLVLACDDKKAEAPAVQEGSPDASQPDASQPDVASSPAMCGSRACTEGEVCVQCGTAYACAFGGAVACCEGTFVSFDEVAGNPKCAGCASPADAGSGRAGGPSDAGASGSYPASDDPASTVDLGKVTDGFSITKPSGSAPITIYLTAALPHGSACGYNMAGLVPLRVPRLYISGIPSQPGSVGADQLAVGAEYRATSISGVPCTMSGNGNFPSVGTLTVTAVDASHIAGSFDITSQDSAAVSHHLVGELELPRDCGAEITSKNPGCCTE